jgi:hypothetical protein
LRQCGWLGSRQLLALSRHARSSFQAHVECGL